MGLAILQKPPVRSPAREALAAAIAKHADAVQNVTACNAAHDSARQAARDADAAVEAAAAAIAEAKTAAVQYLTDVARGTAGEAPLTVKQARANHLAAKDDLEAAIAARDGLEQQRKQAASSANLARMTLDDRLRDAVRDDTDVHALVNEYRKILCDQENRRATLGFLGLSFSGLPANFVPSIDPKAAEFVRALETDADAVF